ncbi:MAG: D-aminoacylase [Dehalococcoidia bacterium]|nr:D-aminoacylase [Bacillota bacterium]
MFDLIIKNGRILDGLGNPWYRGDVGIKDGMIKRIGGIKEGAKEAIDAEGMIVCPGFIDMHSHSDLAFLVNPEAESKILQGVTTEVIGNCGISAAPIKDGTLDQLRDYAGSFLLKEYLNWDWRSFGEYLDKLKEGIAVNVAPLVGQGTIRIAVMGFDNREPEKKELAEMKELLREAMDEGAFGLSTGLIYPPGCFSKTEELIELARVIKDYEGIYFSHIRGESNTLIPALKEAITIGEKAGVSVEISHHKAAGKENWGKVKETLKIIEEARERGLDVTSDQYPYIATSTALSALLPDWVHEGGVKRLVERLKDPQTRKRIREGIEGGRLIYWNPIKATEWSNIVISVVGSEQNKELEGKSIEEIAKLWDKDSFDVLFDLLIGEESDVRMVFFRMSEADVITVMRHPTTMIGSDGAVISREGPLSKGKPHPRSYGTFPRILGKYVREENVLILEDAVRKMTSLPAQKLRLRDRGILKEGYKADIVVFDPGKVKDRATYTDPYQQPEGIIYVLVNGEIAVEGGKYARKTTGKVLRAYPK